MTVRLVFLDDSVQREPIPRRGMAELVASAPLSSLRLGEAYADDWLDQGRDRGPSDEEIKWKPKKALSWAPPLERNVQELRRRLLQAALIVRFGLQ